MTSEELLGVLQELADNHGGVIYDLDDSEIMQLRTVVRQLDETLSQVSTRTEIAALWPGGFDAVMQELQGA